jgi:hypothetical protein
MSSSSGPRRGVKRGLDDPEQSQGHSQSPSNRGEVTIRFRSSDKQRDFVCSPEEQDVLRRRSEYFAELLANNDEDTIEIAEEDCINAVSFLVTLLKDKAPTAHSLGWDESVVGLSVKWLAREYSEVFADMADRHIRAVVGKLEDRVASEEQAARGSVYFSVPAGTDMGTAKGYENKIYDATAEKNEHGVVIYQMRGDPDKVIEYWEPLKRWIWKKRADLGTNKGYIQEVQPGRGASPDLTTVTEVVVATGKPAPDHASAPIKITITPLPTPPPPPSSADVELFWAMSEAVLKYPALARQGGLVREKRGLMKLLSKKGMKALMAKEAMQRVLSHGDTIDLVLPLLP